MKFGPLSLVYLTTIGLSSAFVPWNNSPSIASTTTQKTTNKQTVLYAIGVLAKKAKEATLREYIAGGVEDSVMDQYKIIKEALSKEEESTTTHTPPGPLQQTLTRRKGTITVIAEYKRKLSDSGYIDEVFDPEILSPEFREFGASGIAVMADERMGGCTYADLKSFTDEQRRAKNEVPGPVSIINSDLIVDELQIAQSAACGVKAVVVTLDVVGKELATKLLKAARAVNLEVIMAVSSKEDAQMAIDIGGTILSVINVVDLEERAAVIDGLSIPDDVSVTMIANISANSDKGLQEVEEAWACRDKGFNCVWVSDVLYKSGNNEVEHPGAILKAMTAKSSLRWASPGAQSGRGEGAREYLGDILM